MRWLSFVMLTACLISGTQSATAQDGHTEVRQFFAELQDENTTDQAADKLRMAALKDTDARQFLVEHLPAVIEKLRGPVWMNAIHLAGSLRIAETVPVLAELLKRQDTQIGTITFAEVLRLDDDPAGKALAEIGAPAITEVRHLLAARDRSTRFRAALVLSNMNSTSADEVLSDHVQNENDSDIRNYIQSQLEEHKKTKVY